MLLLLTLFDGGGGCVDGGGISTRGDDSVGDGDGDGVGGGGITAIVCTPELNDVDVDGCDDCDGGGGG